MRPGLTKIVTRPPGGGSPLSLSHIGHVSPARYSWTVPGGCDQLSCILFKPARIRSEALNPGRLVYAYRGGSVVWSGILDEPQPSDAGWQITAHGAGTYGADWRAVYTGSWGTGAFNNAVDAAITRGLDWVRVTDIGAVSGLWAGQKVDSGMQSITDLLNLGTSKGGLTWVVTTGPGGNLLTVFALPTSNNRVLISTAPVGQSVASGPDALYLRYQSAADTNKAAATYALTSVVQQDVIDAQGRREDGVDLSSAGVTTAGAAQGVGSSVLKRFTRAGFTDAIQAPYGALCSNGGTPVDPGVFYPLGSPPFVRVLLTDFAFGGEVTRGPVQFMVGAYEWDDGSMIASITPFESMRHDFASLLSAAVDDFHPRQKPVHKKKKGR